MRNRNYFLFFFTCSFLIAQNSNELSPKKLKDISPNWPIIINNTLDDSTSFDLVLKADSTKYISEGYRVQILATRYFEYADSLAILSLIHI